jgi:flagellum-specific peptidoglycan hydrolase FlgJ
MRTLIPALALLLSACTSSAQPPAAHSPQLEIHAVAPLPKPRKACIESIYEGKLRRTDSAAVQYIKAHADDALFIEFHYGLPASLTLAVGMYESAFGTSNIAKNAHNHFGQKFYKAPQYLGELNPYRCQKGTLWQAYSTPRESYKAFANSFALAPYIYPYCEELTPDKFAQTGWGGGKNKRRYAAHLKSIISRYNLDKI